jgi:lipooligosaccharide transport system ATP-binding protein
VSQEGEIETDAPRREGPMIEAKGLTKRFDDFVAVDGIDFEVATGETFGFLGPNGAGKSSTMRMIAATSPRSGGDLKVLGLDPASEGSKIRARLGVVPQDDNLDTELTVWDNLMIYGRYFGLPRSELKTRATELLDFFQLAERRDDKVDPLSGGMKRRLAVARGLINEPSLFLLDEPTTGLDPQARHLLWERLFRLKRDGVTIVLTTHYMDEAEQLCDRLVIMDGGHIVAEGSPRELIRRHSTAEVVELRYLDPAEHHRSFGLVDGTGDRVERLTDRIVVYTADGDATLAALENKGVDTTSAYVRRSSLEDVFLTLTGRSLQD